MTTRVSVHPTIVRLGLRGLFGRWRGVLLFLLPAVLVALAVLVRVLVGTDEQAATATLRGLGLVVVVPLIALLAASGLLAAEIDDGSISYLLAKPIPRGTIVLSKLVVALACSVVFGAVPMLLAGLILRTDDAAVGLGFGLAAVAAGAAYCALFALFSVLTRHAIVVGLIYVLVWEALLGGLLAGIRWLSITRWASEIVDRVAGLQLVSDLPLTYAVLATLVVIAAAAGETSRRLRGFNLTGDE